MMDYCIYSYIVSFLRRCEVLNNTIYKLINKKKGAKITFVTGNLRNAAFSSFGNQFYPYHILLSPKKPVSLGLNYGYYFF